MMKYSTYGYCFAPDSSLGPTTALTSKNGLGAIKRGNQ